MAPSSKRPSADVLSLPKTRLAVRDDALVKTSRRGDVMARHDFSDLHGVEVVRTFDFTAIPFYLVGGALVLMPLLRFALLPRFWPLLVLGLAIVYLGAKIGTRAALRLRVGARIVDYDVLEADGDAEGFAASLDELLDARRDSAISERSPA
ncbi:MAG: hypothetical protein AAGE94_08355 [Acidobacteriota bacterium]